MTGNTRFSAMITQLFLGAVKENANRERGAKRMNRFAAFLLFIYTVFSASSIEATASRVSRPIHGRPRSHGNKPWPFQGEPRRSRIKDRTATTTTANETTPSTGKRCTRHSGAPPSQQRASRAPALESSRELNIRPDIGSPGTLKCAIRAISLMDRTSRGARYREFQLPL